MRGSLHSRREVPGGAETMSLASGWRERLLVGIPSLRKALADEGM